MTITSFAYLLFLAAGVFIYYLLPRKWQWVELLGLSILFYCIVATPYTLIYILIATAAVYFATAFLEKGGRKAATAGVIAVVINAVLWFALKGYALWAPLFQVIGITVKAPVAALGMGYYTLQAVGYILDCYWGNSRPLKNPLQLLLFLCFFPQMITGPISRFCELEDMYEGRGLSYQNLTYGAQRILWGFFKKLVLAERVGVLVTAIWGDPWQYNGFYSWIAFVAFPLQLYADFSGCIDIALGTAELFGISLPENFNSPFFSRTTQEFWQRWHITLGTWTKDYILYPVLKCSAMQKLSRFLQKKWGKKNGKLAVTAVGMFCVWLFIGLWHGEMKYVVGESLWYWILLMLGEIFAKRCKKWKNTLGITEDSFSWHLFQSLRTFLIYAIGIVFFRADNLKEAFSFLGDVGGVLIGRHFNPWVLFDGSMEMLGISSADLWVIFWGVVLLFVVGALREKYGYAREWVSRQLLPFRWLVWCGLFLFVVLYGKYGAQYDSVNFIYQAF